ncbi:hypothetical protein LTR78_010640 [Recurvomyces mirabilis]|uniref:Uncharacterized protein n=1 Tax=Recurvomyces mirabilis TaxID=574656 RepID=A0AAE0TM40_9PEZI|nr:hypothetical protein LTR78_010640 [Recurvomyces mirabilis]
MPGCSTYVLAAIMIYATSWAGGRHRIRGWIFVFNTIVGLVGLPIMAFHGNPNVRLFGAFLGVAGANASIPGTMAYQANNIRGRWKRAFCSATSTQDSPGCTWGFVGTIVANCVLLIAVALLNVVFRRRNNLADEGKLVIEGLERFLYTL